MRKLVTVLVVVGTLAAGAATSSGDYFEVVTQGITLSDGSRIPANWPADTPRPLSRETVLDANGNPITCPGKSGQLTIPGKRQDPPAALVQRTRLGITDGVDRTRFDSTPFVRCGSQGQPVWVAESQRTLLRSGGTVAPTANDAYPVLAE